MTSAFGRGGSAAAPFDLGRTATHEVGHYLNLSHIWGEARVPTCTDTDSVDDTPNQWGPNFGKPTFPSASCEQRARRRHVHELHGLRGRRHHGHVHRRPGGPHARGAGVRPPRPRAARPTSRPTPPALVVAEGTAPRQRSGDVAVGGPDGPRLAARPGGGDGHVRVYHPAGHPFPPARGPGGADLPHDGRFDYRAPGRGRHRDRDVARHRRRGARGHRRAGDPAVHDRGGRRRAAPASGRHP